MMGSSGIKIVLKCKDGGEFEVSKAVVSQMQNIKRMISDDETSCCIIPMTEEVRGPVLAKLILYCERHAKDDQEDEDNLKSFDDEFFKVPRGVIFDLLLGAHILGMRGLVKLLSQEVAGILKDKKIVLKCNDGSEFEVSMEVASQMQIIKHLITKDDDDAHETIIPVPDEVRGPVLAKLLEYCTRHAKAPLDDNEDDNLKSFDDEFVKKPHALLCELLMGANKLGMGDLIDLLCQAVAAMSIEDKSGGIKIVMKCKDGSEYEVSKEVASQMQNIKHLIKDDDGTIIYVADEIRSPVLANLIEYCERHAKDDDKDKLKSFDDEFLEKHQDEALQTGLLWGANNLGIKGLVDILCQSVAVMIRDKSPEEIREIFHLENDLTPEDEERIRNDHPWVFK